MRPLRRPPRSTIHYHGRTDEADDITVLTFSINGIRYEYHLRPQQAEDCLHIIRVAGNGKALAYAKSHAVAFTRLDNTCARAATLRSHRGAIASRSKRQKVTLPNV